MSNRLKNQEEFMKTINYAKTKMEKITLKELLNTEYPPIKWAIPNLLPEGVAILGGKPKHGKSLLAMNISLAIANGDKVLNNIESQKGKAFFCSHFGMYF